MKYLKKIVYFLAIALSLAGMLYLNVNPRWTIFGVRPLKVMTASMEPTLMSGDWVFGEKPGKISIGDICTYKADEVLITHRVVGINGDGTYEFQGDNNAFQLESDKKVPEENVLFIIRKGER